MEHRAARNAVGEEVALTHAMIEDLLRRTPRQADGSLRVCASRWLAARSLGPWAYTGRRKDDRNDRSDRIDHANRRDVRAFGVFAAWVNDIDTLENNTLENNTLDAYVGADGHGHVVHYQQDVGGSLGQFAAVPAEVWMGQETYFMPGRIFASLFSFGILARTFDDDRKSERRRLLMATYPELGYFDDDGFDPWGWHPVLDNPALVRMTPRDRYWGAKQIVAFTAEEVRAAVALGHYEPATAERLFQILWHRREQIARALLATTAPLDYFRFESEQSCVDDLWLEAGPGGADATRYFVVRGKRRSDRGAARCMTAPSSEGNHVFERGVLRQPTSRRPPTVKVHYIAAGGFLRVVGIER